MFALPPLGDNNDQNNDDDNNDQNNDDNNDDNGRVQWASARRRLTPTAQRRERE